MNNNPAILTVITSLRKTNIDVQQQALDTWRKCGFSIISVNAAEEIDGVGEHFPGVGFAVDRNAKRDSSGNYYVMLDSMLAELRHSKGRYAAIAYSDVCFSSEFLPLLTNNVEESIVFGTQILSETLEKATENIWGKGFDFLFFDKKNSIHYPAADFLFGACWWDCWLLVNSVIHNVSIKRISEPAKYYQSQPANREADKGLVEFAHLMARKIDATTIDHGHNVPKYYYNTMQYLWDRSIPLFGERNA